MKITTWPDESQMKQFMNATPEHMYRNNQPYAAIYEGFLTDAECDLIISEQGKLESYSFDHCDAKTTECEQPISADLQQILTVLQYANMAFWGYDIDLDSAQAWMQTYAPGGSYQRHMDGTPGQCRKLTAVAILTKPNQYIGGNLIIDVPPNKFNPPVSRGTIVVFPGWLIHEVTSLESGHRQTINLGVWGPAWR